MLYTDREDAGRLLAAELKRDGVYDHVDRVVGLARGGVVLAAAIAEYAQLPLSALLVDDHQDSQRQVFVSPWGNAMVRSYANKRHPVETWHDCHAESGEDVGALFQAVCRRQDSYETDTFREGERILLVDDGLVSGKTARFAVRTLKMFAAASQCIVAVPVLPAGMQPQDLRADDINFLRRSLLERPPTGMFYTNFDDVSDDKVRRLVQKLKGLRQAA